MSILVDKNTRIVVHGITGREGTFHTRQMVEYGSVVAAGVTPGKGGQNVDGMKPIGQSMPPQATQFAPDNAQPISMSDLTDDEIPF